MRPGTVTLAALLLGGWSPLAAQNALPPATFSSSLVVTASLEPEAAEDLVATVDVVDAEAIDHRRAERVLDLLRELPGLDIVQSGSPGKVTSLFSRGTNSGHTRVLLDGIPLNDPVLGAFDWSSEATEGLERVEVARGPFSALWGSSAVGGVVQLVTRRPASRGGGVRVEGGSNAYRRATAQASLPFDRFGIDLSGHLRRGDGERTNDFFDSDAAQLRLDAGPWAGWRVGLLARASDSEIGLPEDFAGTPTPRRAQRGSGRLLALPVDAVLGDWQVELRLGRHAADLDVSDPDDPFAASETETERDTARGVVRRRVGEAAWVAAGAEWGRETASTSSAFGAGLDGAEQTARALFAQGSWAGRRVRLELGARRDDVSSFGGETSLRAGAVAELGGGARLRASWGESFRAPSLGDLYSPGFGNPELEAERGASWEAGVELERGPLGARLTGFRNDLEDLIQFDFATFLPFNVGQARTQGIEGGVRFASGGWRARADATWLETEDRSTGAPLPRRPEWSGAVALEWIGERAGGAARLRTVGAREDVGRVRLDGYTVLDLTASVELGGGFAPWARLENALGESYEEAAGYPAPGRAWVLGLGWRAGR